jgi:hypothetical protein
MQMYFSWPALLLKEIMVSPGVVDVSGSVALRVLYG